MQIVFTPTSANKDFGATPDQIRALGRVLEEPGFSTAVIHVLQDDVRIVDVTPHGMYQISVDGEVKQIDFLAGENEQEVEAACEELLGRIMLDLDLD